MQPQCNTRKRKPPVGLVGYSNPRTTSTDQVPGPGTTTNRKRGYDMMIQQQQQQQAYHQSPLDHYYPPDDTQQQIANLRHNPPFPIIPDRDVQLHVSSDDRDRYNFPNSNHFVVPISDRVRNGDRLQSISLDHIVVPNVAYSIDENHNTLWISEDGFLTDDESPTSYFLKIPPATYTATSLVTTLNEMAQCWVPNTAIAISPVSADPLRDRATDNVYEWFYDSTHYRIALRASAGSSGALRGVQIHCPPKELACNETRDTMNMRAYKSDILISSASNQTSDVIRINTGGMRHNLVANAPIELIVIRSLDRIGREIRFTNVALYTSTDFATGASIGTETFDIHIASASATWTGTFDNTLDTRFTGFVRTACAANSLWDILGYTNSIDGYTTLTALAISDGNAVNNDLGVHSITTDLPMYFDTLANGVVIPAASSLTDLLSVSTFTVSATIAGTTLTNTDADIFNDTAVVLGSNPILHRVGYFVGDQTIDLRGHSLNVLMRLQVNGVEIGRKMRAGNGSTSRLPPHSGVAIAPPGAMFFGQIYLDAAFGGTVERFRESHSMGDFQHFYHPFDPATASAIMSHAEIVSGGGTRSNTTTTPVPTSAPTGFQDLLHKVEVELFTDQGVRLAIGKTRWGFTLGLHYSSGESMGL